MNVQTWRRINATDQVPSIYQALDSGAVLAEVVNTSQTGTDDYPWDWYLTDAAVQHLEQYGKRPQRISGVADTLRSAKATIEAIFNAEQDGATEAQGDV